MAAAHLDTRKQWLPVQDQASSEGLCEVGGAPEAPPLGEELPTVLAAEGEPLSLGGAHTHAHMDGASWT